MKRFLSGGFFAFAGVVVLATVLLVGCGDPVGSVCETTGSGFHAQTNCRHRCLSRWKVTCPNGERIAPNVCTGAFGCEVGGCPDGQVCYHDDDPFDDRSFCVADTTCGSYEPAELEEWERNRVEVQAEVRSRRIEKEARRARWRAENPDASKVALPAED